MGGKNLRRRAFQPKSYLVAGPGDEIRMSMNFFFLNQILVDRTLIDQHLFIPAVSTVVFSCRNVFSPFVFGWNRWPFHNLFIILSSLEFVLYVNISKATFPTGSIQNCGTQCNMWSFSCCFISPFYLFSTPKALEASYAWICVIVVWAHAVLYFFLYCGRFCLRSAVTFFFSLLSMNVNHHPRPAKAVSAVTDAAFTALSFRAARNTLLTAEDVHDPAAVRSSDSSFIVFVFWIGHCSNRMMRADSVYSLDIPSHNIFR